MIAVDLHDAITSQNLVGVRQILVERPADIEGTDEDSVPLCFLAARTGNLELVRFLVEYSRANMNVTDSLNRNILHYGAASGNPDVTAYLVERVGMSPLTGDVNLVTPFDVAKEGGHQEVMAYFEQICGTSLSGMFRNPVRTGMFPDPSVVRVGEDYYMVNSSFIFFPCIPISHSKDLIHWEIIGYGIANPDWSELGGLEGGRGYWAPDISWHEGRFYIAATYRMNDGSAVCRRQMVTWSDCPQGPYSKPVFIDEDGIDPSLFWEEDGRCFMLLNRGARILELSSDASRKISESSLLYYGSQKKAPEGPHLLKWNGYYYLFLAEGGTGIGHRITVSRSETLMGIYEPCPYNPIMHQSDKQAGIQRCGHGKPVMTQNGQWYMVYLCGRMLEGQYTVLGRETALDPIIWTKDGWPLVNHLAGPSVLQIKPRLPESTMVRNTRDDFDGEWLGLDWISPREPDADGYGVENSHLWVKGSEAPLSSPKARGVVLRRQTDFGFVAETCMNLEKMNGFQGNQDAGLICYYDENTWLKFGVFHNGAGVMKLMIVEHIGDEDRKTDMELNQKVSLISAGRIYLKVETEGLKRVFYWHTGQKKDWQLFAYINRVDYLCDEGISRGKRFTGAMVGMYACAGVKPLTAVFEYFDYQDTECRMTNL